MDPSIYRGTSTGYKADVNWAENPTEGVNYCMSGIARYELCDQYLNSTAPTQICATDFYTMQRVCVNVLIMVGPGACHGDSGAPVFLVRSDGKVGARAILSAIGPSYENQPMTPLGCTEAGIHGGWATGYNYVVPWNMIKDYFGITIMASG